MKTKLHLCILWSVLSLGLLSCAAHISKFTKDKNKVSRSGSPKPKPTKVLTTSGRKSSYRSPAGTSLLSQPNSLKSDPPLSSRPREPQAKTRSDFAYLPDVSVTCSTSDFVARVKPIFYGLGAGADELKLGSSCKSNGVLRPSGDLLFAYPLTACDATRQLLPGYLVYKFILHYEPSPKRFPSKAHPIDVNIECRYQRNHHVYQLTVQPTWETAVMHKRLKGNLNDFQMELMDDSWTRPSKVQVYQLGKTVNFQVSAPNLPTEGKVYISSCYATPSTGSKSLKYTIIDNFGCMIDSKRDPGASQFISRTDKTLRFSLKAFQFTSDPDMEVSIDCKLLVTSEDPSPAQKSCTYRVNRWKALTGDDSICECCDSQCVTSKPKRDMIEGSVSSGSLLVSDQPSTTEDGFLSARISSISRSRDGQAITSHYIDELHSYEDLLESEDVVNYDEEGHVYLYEEEEEDSGVISEETAELDLDESGFRETFLVEEKEPEVSDSNLFEDEGSGHLGGEVVSESEEEEGGEDGISDGQKEAEVELEKMLPLQANLQTELKQPPVSEDEEENSKKSGGDEEDLGMIAAEEESKQDYDDKEQTWYFSWR